MVGLAEIDGEPSTVCVCSYSNCVLRSHLLFVVYVSNFASAKGGRLEVMLYYIPFRPTLCNKSVTLILNRVKQGIINATEFLIESYKVCMCKLYDIHFHNPGYREVRRGCPRS